MPTEPGFPASTLSRRHLLGGTVGLAAGVALTRGLPGGVFVAGSERMRVGLVGCGGRGTGAAMQAVMADRAVRIVAIGDLFADQVATAAAILGRATDDGFACPPDARFVGAEAWRQVIEADVDMVILATPPDCRPLHLAAAVAAGKHVYCETPAAIDMAGAETMAAACATARDRGLSLMSGLAWRRDRDTDRLVGRLHDGTIGRLLAARMTTRVGLPWHRSAEPGWSACESRRRNWIACPDQSGGDVVERQVHAIDKALWVLGDEDPVAVESLGSATPDGTPIRFLFADGRTLTIDGGRRAGQPDVASEIIHGERGRCDLRQAGRDGPPVGRGLGAGRHQAAIGDLIEALRTGRRVDDGPILVRATTASLLGRAAAAAATALPWQSGPTFTPPRPV